MLLIDNWTWDELLGLLGCNNEQLAFVQEYFPGSPNVNFGNTHKYIYLNVQRLFVQWYLLTS